MATFTFSRTGGQNEADARTILEVRIWNLQILSGKLDHLRTASTAMLDTTADGPLACRIVRGSLDRVATGSALPLARTGFHEIEVKSLAVAHRIMSDTMTSRASTIPAGPYEFELGAGARSTAIRLAEDQIQTLITLGIAANANGALSLDPEALSYALATTPDAVMEALQASKGSLPALFIALATQAMAEIAERHESLQEHAAWYDSVAKVAMAGSLARQALGAYRQQGGLPPITELLA